MKSLFEKLPLVILGLVLLACIGLAASISLNGYRTVEGHVVGHAYTAGNVGVGSGVNVSTGDPSVVTTVTGERFTLMIETNGAVSSYDVSIELYAKVLAGQTTIQMRCNDVTCAIVE